MEAEPEALDADGPEAQERHAQEQQRPRGEAEARHPVCCLCVLLIRYVRVGQYVSQDESEGDVKVKPAVSASIEQSWPRWKLRWIFGATRPTESTHRSDLTGNQAHPNDPSMSKPVEGMEGSIASLLSER